MHYKLGVGQLRPGDPADFIVVNNIREFKILKTFIDGDLVAEHGETKIKRVENKVVNNFSTGLKAASDFEIKAQGKKIRVIVAEDGQLITKEQVAQQKTENGFIVPDIKNDILKITVVNRYADSKPSVGFIRNFGIMQGALASSVAHDSHNIIAVGTDDESITRAVNLIIEKKGGVSAVNGRSESIVPLPVGGIMSAEDGYSVASAYKEIDQMAKSMGSKLSAPFMTLSFMALLVIPSLKLSDKGLFDGNNFSFRDVTLD